MPRNFVNKLVGVYVLACAFAVSALAYTLTEANWDLLAYSAIVHEGTIQDVGQLHAKVYADARANLSADEFNDITGRNSYRKTMLEDSEAFYQQLPYYRIKLAFTTALKSLSEMGVSVSTASRLVVIGCAFFSLLVLFKAFQPHVNAQLWVLFPAIVILGGVLKTARTVSPDTMALLAMSVVVLLYLRGHWLMYVMLFLCVFIRTDLLIFVVSMLGLRFFFSDDSKMTIITCLLSTLLVYLLIGHYYGGGYGWTTLFYFVIESNMLATHPAEYANQTVSVGQYLKLMAVNIPRAIFYPGFWFFLVCSFLSLFIVWSEQRATDWKSGLITMLEQPIVGVIVVSLIYVVGHIVLFPLWETRFFVAPYTLCALCLLSVLSTQLNLSSRVSAEK